MILTAAGFLLAACQSYSYKIEGKADFLQDGDTLFITKNFFTGAPIDTMILRDGAFETDGQTDSTTLCMVYSKKDYGFYFPFFIEPGTIKLKLYVNPLECSASGTSTNNKWQKINISLMDIGRHINSIANNIQSNDLSYEEQAELIKEYNGLFVKYRDLILEHASKNTDNEIGYFLLTYYSDMDDTNNDDDMSYMDKKMELIKKMPQDMQNRPAIKEVVARIEKVNAFAEGKKITDFTMHDIAGNPIRLLDEVKKNPITIIDFWASWCGPCLAEMPYMVEMYKRYNEKGLGLFGVSLDSDKEKWGNATKRFDIEWPQVSDLKGWNNAAAKMFNVKSIPFTIVVGKDGTILKIGLRGAELEEYVRTTLEKQDTV